MVSLREPPPNAPLPVGAQHGGRSRPRRLAGVVVAAALGFVRHRASSRAAALAFYTLLSLAPTLVLVVAVAGEFFNGATVRSNLATQMDDLAGAAAASAVSAVLAAPHTAHGSLIATALSALLILFSATSAFAELKDSLDELWDVPAHDAAGIWGLLRERFLSLSVLIILALLLLASLSVNAALAALGSFWGGYWVASAFAELAAVFSQLFGFAVVTALFAAVFKLLPSVTIAWRDVLLGASVTALLFTAGKSLIGLYLGHGAVGSAYGAAGSLVALIVWIYYSAAIFFFGSLLTHEYAYRFGSRHSETREPAGVPLAHFQD